MNRFSLLTFAAVLTLAGCKKDDNSPTTIPAKDYVQQGKWKVTLLQEDSRNETATFAGYEFQFLSNGQVTAVHSSAPTGSGTWSTRSSDDDNTPHFTLSFGNTAPFQELNDDWHVVEQTSTSLKLTDVSGGNGGTDYLNLEKL
ncbi:hypothetical protein [Hymenobacter sp. BT730]|uniref:hypothetical protein n=1 Tax=Hymenobacter sp. BT730 TaxID=3063332 RepID=UPI0026E101D0|nr:hypothetical protein [Hymenobacter sp. BT730]